MRADFRFSRCFPFPLFCSAVLVACLAALVPALSGCGGNAASPDPASAIIQDRILTAGLPPRLLIQSDSVRSFRLVRLFYERRAYRPVWSSAKSLGSDADSLLAVIRRTAFDGLRPADYHLEALRKGVADLRSSATGQELDAGTRADLDLLLTDAFFLCASHLGQGSIDRDSLRPRWTIDREDLHLDSLLEESIRTHSVARNLELQSPRHQYYSDLRNILASFLRYSQRGTWGSLPGSGALKGGDKGPRVFAVRNRMRASGDLLARSGAGTDEYDSTLVDAVRVFQKRHGLAASGVADSTTIAMMNVTLPSRIDQVRANLERWRWMTHDLGRSSVLINIPDYRLMAVDDGREVLSMKVVLGLAGWQTPVFSAYLTQVLFNSHWMAPEDIVEKELINYMKADSNYLRNNAMTLWRESDDSLVQVDPRTIDWPAMNEKTIDFRLRQEPGPQNIMGQVKFLIPNPYNIYLHDTPYREDFAKTVRMFSHGCIRLERPFDLAEHVLRGFPQWTKDRIDTLVARNTEQAITIRKSLPVHILYFTVWKDEGGSIQFRDDCYGLDRKIAAALPRSE